MSSIPLRSSPNDANFAFLKLMDKHPLQQSLPHQIIQRKIKTIARSLVDLHPDQISEWKRLQLLKINQLSNKVIEELQAMSQGEGQRKKESQKKVVVKEHLRLLVYICNDLKTSYEARRIQDVIKAVYFEQYREDILRKFEEVGYDMGSYQTLNYSDQWCCCSWFG